MALPPEIQETLEYSPVEDILLHLLRPHFQPYGIPVRATIADLQEVPFIMVRRTDSFGFYGSDARFIDDADIAVHTFTRDPDGDEDGALLSEAVRVALDRSVNVVVPGRGHITRVRLIGAPRRVTDWASASGPVQFADLPTGVHRYETRYQIEVRRPPSLDLTPPPE